ncbi:hypothetical protein DPMN_144105 [Dreissena polymorpha]|uniref:Uncharacterized protein n=1 Tax=Dreissena polymorpha TaxID=45954 RepID=A0A9D4GET4_DREPO|nr:hypothetical protein DPMN_144105 [Dreissena polymorpha]
MEILNDLRTVATNMAHFMIGQVVKLTCKANLGTRRNGLIVWRNSNIVTGSGMVNYIPNNNESEDGQVVANGCHFEKTDSIMYNMTDQDAVRTSNNPLQFQCYKSVPGSFVALPETTVKNFFINVHNVNEITTGYMATAESNKQLMCYSCDDMSHLELCDTVTKYGDREVCVVERTNAKYRSGCANSSICSMSYPSSSNCAECCNNDYCNGRGCGDEGLVSRQERGHCAMTAITCEQLANASPLDRAINISHAVSRNLNGWITHTTSLGVWIYRADLLGTDCYVLRHAANPAVTKTFVTPIAHTTNP